MVRIGCQVTDSDSDVDDSNALFKCLFQSLYIMFWCFVSICFEFLGMNLSANYMNNCNLNITMDRLKDLIYDIGLIITLFYALLYVKV